MRAGSRRPNGLNILRVGCVHWLRCEELTTTAAAVLDEGLDVTDVGAELVDGGGVVVGGGGVVVDGGGVVVDGGGVVVDGGPQR
jgi:hypothetical protein